MDTETLRRAIRPRLEKAFGSRLRGIVLFGSRVRGEAAQDSDVDLLVLLDDPVTVGRDIDTIVEALYPLQLEIDAPIHALPARFETYQQGTFSLYRNARGENPALSPVSSDWLARADQALSSARLLLDSDPDGAASRSYDAPF